MTRQEDNFGQLITDLITGRGRQLFCSFYKGLPSVISRILNKNGSLRSTEVDTDPFCLNSDQADR